MNLSVIRYSIFALSYNPTVNFDAVVGIVSLFENHFQSFFFTESLLSARTNDDRLILVT